MADKEAKPTGDATLSEDAPAGSGRLMVKIIVLAFILAVVVGECLLAYLWIPKMTPQSVPIEQIVLTPPEMLEASDLEMAGINDAIEVDLGQYTVQAFQPSSNTVRVVDFHLWGLINREDEQSWHILFGEHERRMRDQIIVIVRSAEASDLNDPGLGLIKRQILKKTNSTLGKPLLKSTVFSDFSFLEQ